MIRSRVRRLVLRATVGAAALAVAALALAPTGDAQAGPPLSVPETMLTHAVRCPATVEAGAHEPVLLVHGTYTNAAESWSWNYEPRLAGLGFVVCTVDLPGRAADDIQVSAEYVVYAVRYMAARWGRQVDVIGHSQGTLEPRWAVRWWPDVRAAVDDLVLLAGPNHGIYSASAICALGACSGAAWQMRIGSAFLAALNAGDETPGAVSVTSIWSDLDELVQPVLLSAAPTPALAGATNVSVQSVCPGRPVHHVGLLEDAVVYRLVLDALTRPGGADPAAVTSEACSSVLAPGVSLTGALVGNVQIYGNGVVTLLGAELLTNEPPLAGYVAA